MQKLLLLLFSAALMVKMQAQQADHGNPQSSTTINAAKFTAADWQADLRFR